MKTKPCIQLDGAGYFVGLTVADESPLEPGVFLSPANTVDAEPPVVPDGSRAKWNGTGFDIESAPVPPDPPVPTIKQLKAAKNTEINFARAAANTSTFTHDGRVFSCDALSRGDIDGVNGYVALEGAMPPGFPGFWKAADNSYYMIPDVAGWKAFYTSMVVAGSANFAHAEALKGQLAVANTTHDIAAILW